MYSHNTRSRIVLGTDDLKGTIACRGILEQFSTGIIPLNANTGGYIYHARATASVVTNGATRLTKSSGINAVTGKNIFAIGIAGVANI